MKKVLVGLLALAVIALSVPLAQTLAGIGGGTVETSNPKAKLVRLPAPTASLEESSPEKVVSVGRSVRLELKNTAVLRGPVTGDTVGKLMKELTEMSRRLNKNDKIYLVLDTPGGSVMDGADLIDFLEALPQKVTTVTLFAASMGFQIAENNPGERLIVKSGILMSHRAAIDGLAGQFDGELESRYRMYKRQIDYLELVDATRMGITLDQYKAMVKSELWVHGFDAVDMKVADAQVLVTCGESMKGTDIITVQTFFGPAEIIFDKCPLIRQPLGIRLGQVRRDAQNYVYTVLYDLFYNKEKFTKEVVLTNKFYTIFR